MNSKKITVIGDGGWGTTLAMILNQKGNSVTIWGVFPDYIETMKSKRENVKFLPGIKISEEIALTSDLATAVRDTDILVLAAPSQHMREVGVRMQGMKLCGKLLVSVAKGIENHSLMRMSQVVHDVLGNVRIGVLSGPTISYEVARGLPTTVVAASEDEKTAQEIQDLFMTENFRIYTNTDLIGVELGGSLKNVIAIAPAYLTGSVSASIQNRACS